MSASCSPCCIKNLDASCFRWLPASVALFTTAIVTALLTVALTVLVLRFGVPGLFGSLLVR